MYLCAMYYAFIMLVPKSDSTAGVRNKRNKQQQRVEKKEECQKHNPGLQFNSPYTLHYVIG